MKHDEFHDELAELAVAYQKTPWWRPFKARSLRKEINRRWCQFIKEISDEQEDIKLLLPPLAAMVENILLSPSPGGELSLLPQETEVP